jgi:hypothetical protein
MIQVEAEFTSLEANAAPLMFRMAVASKSSVDRGSCVAECACLNKIYAHQSDSRTKSKCIVNVHFMVVSV